MAEYPSVVFHNSFDDGKVLNADAPYYGIALVTAFLLYEKIFARFLNK